LVVVALPEGGITGFPGAGGILEVGVLLGVVVVVVVSSPVHPATAPSIITAQADLRIRAFFAQIYMFSDLF